MNNQLIRQPGKVPSVWKTVFGHKWPDNLYNLGVEYLKTNELPSYFNSTDNWIGVSFVNRMSYYFLKDNKIYFKTKIKRGYNDDSVTNDYDLIYTIIKDSDKLKILSEINSDPATSALGLHSLLDKVLQQQYLGISRSDVDKYLKNNKNLKQVLNKNEKPIISSFRPRYTMQHWQMDLIILNKDDIKRENDDYAYIFVIIDIFSKFIYVYPLKTKSKEIISKWLLKLFLSGDIPHILHSDNAKEFRDLDVCKQFNVIQRYGANYSPQTQGFVENKNKHIKKLLTFYLIKYNTLRYYDILDRIAFSINNTKHNVTGYTPMHVHRGRGIFVQNEYLESNIEMAETIILPEEKNEYDTYIENISNLQMNITNIVKNKIEITANKREQFQKNKTNELSVFDLVKIVTYVEDNDDILPLFIEFYNSRSTAFEKVIHPLKIKKTNELGMISYEHLNVYKPYKITLFNKLQLRTNKFYQDIYEIYAKIRKNNRTYYKVRTLGHDNSEKEIIRTLKSTPDVPEWVELFDINHLIPFKEDIKYTFKTLFIDPFDEQNNNTNEQYNIQEVNDVQEIYTEPRKIDNVLDNKPLKYYKDKIIYKEFEDPNQDEDIGSTLYKGIIQLTRKFERPFVIKYIDGDSEDMDFEEMKRYLTPEQQLTDSEYEYVFSNKVLYENLPIIYYFEESKLIGIKKDSLKNCKIVWVTNSERVKEFRIIIYSLSQLKETGRDRTQRETTIPQKNSKNKSLFENYGILNNVGNWIIDGNDIMILLKLIIKEDDQNRRKDLLEILKKLKLDRINHYKNKQNIANENKKYIT